MNAPGAIDDRADRGVPRHWSEGLFCGDASKRMKAASRS